MFYTLVFTLNLLFPTSFPTIHQTASENSDEVSVKAAVVNWADETFRHHESYKFDQYRVAYTDEYFIQTSRIELYEEKIALLKSDKAAGKYSGSDVQFEKDLARYEESIADATEKCKTIEPIDHYSIHFWSNIMTDDGITVYYELIVMLDSKFTITQATENSSIGKKSPTSKISYNKDISSTRVIEKS